MLNGVSSVNYSPNVIALSDRKNLSVKYQSPSFKGLQAGKEGTKKGLSLLFASFLGFLGIKSAQNACKVEKPLEKPVEKPLYEPASKKDSYWNGRTLSSENSLRGYDLLDAADMKGNTTREMVKDTLRKAGAIIDVD